MKEVLFLLIGDGSSETEEKIKKETKATIRCIPAETVGDKGFCYGYQQTIISESFVCQSLLIETF